MLAKTGKRKHFSLLWKEYKTANSALFVISKTSPKKKILLKLFTFDKNVLRINNLSGIKDASTTKTTQYSRVYTDYIRMLNQNCFFNWNSSTFIWNWFWSLINRKSKLSHLVWCSSLPFITKYNNTQRTHTKSESCFSCLEALVPSHTTFYCTTQALGGPITKINQSKCSIAGPIFSKYWTGHCLEWSRTLWKTFKAFFSRIINLLSTKLARDRTGRISALGPYCQDLGPIFYQYGPRAWLIRYMYYSPCAVLSFSLFILCLIHS